MPTLLNGSVLTYLYFLGYFRSLVRLELTSDVFFKVLTAAWYPVLPSEISKVTEGLQVFPCFHYYCPDNFRSFSQCKNFPGLEEAWRNIVGKCPFGEKVFLLIQKH